MRLNPESVKPNRNLGRGTSFLFAIQRSWSLGVVYASQQQQQQQQGLLRLPTHGSGKLWFSQQKCRRKAGAAALKNNFGGGQAGQNKGRFVLLAGAVLFLYVRCEGQHRELYLARGESKRRNGIWAGAAGLDEFGVNTQCSISASQVE